jgi:ketosteroid isomerase-like protein
MMRLPLLPSDDHYEVTTMEADKAPEHARSILDANKALARRWVDAVNRRDETAVRAVLTDNFLYSGMGRAPEEIAVRWNKDEFVATVLRARSRMKKPVVMTVIRDLAEGNRVTVETEGSGEMSDGFAYANAYCLLFEIDAGKIKSVRDYCCTHTAVVAAAHAGQ